MTITSSNPNAFKALTAFLEGMEGVQSKAGWFESAKYPDGTPVAAAAQWNEFGVPSRSIPARPFMRPTVSENQQAWADDAGKLSKRVVDGKMTPFDAMDALALKAVGDIVKTISQVYDPPLSPITLLARKRRQEGGAVTGKTIGEFAKQLNAGPPDVSGVSTKPLNDSGLMVATATHVTEKL